MEFVEVVADVSQPSLPQSKPRTSPWTEKKIEQLKVLWAEGHSASRIAYEIGRLSMSRCAVIGKARRLGLERRVEKENPNGKFYAPGKERAPRAKRAARPKKYDTFLDKIFGARSEPPPPAIEDLSHACTFMELTPSSCRWPIGDPGTPEFRFCGARKLDGFSYCAAHYARAHGQLALTERERLRRHYRALKNINGKQAA